MPESSPFPAELIGLVRGALAHLYDHALLQNHPLAALVDRDNHLDPASRAQRVRRLLLDCIESLRPPADAPADTARAYALLDQHYLDGHPVPVIADKLGLSQRQAYRELDKGVRAITNLLWEKAASDIRRIPLARGDVSRSQMAQQEVERLRPCSQREVVDLADLLVQTAQLLLPLCEETGTRVRLVSPESWPTVVADRTMVRQAMLNLLSYATRAVGGDATITLAHLPEGVEIAVAAVPSRAAGHSTVDTQESEIELTVAKSLAQAWGGKIEVGRDSSGWRATAWLPTSHRPMLLAIDDNVDIVALFERYLSNWGAVVAGIQDAKEAVRLAAALQPRVITLDVMMPGRDGWEVLQALKTSPQTRHIPVVICSVLHEPQLAQALGAGGYVTKPVSQARLLQALHPWLAPLPPVE